MIADLIRDVQALGRRIARLETQSGPGRWVDWTPAVTQSGAVTVTVTEAKYCVIGKVCHVYANLAITGTGSAGSVISCSLPVACAASATHSPGVAAGMYYDNPTRDYPLVVRVTSATTVAFATVSADGNGWLGITPSFAAANTDELSFSATYRVA